MRKMTLLQNKLKCYIDDVGTGHRSATLTMERAAVAQRQKEAAMEEERSAIHLIIYIHHKDTCMIQQCMLSQL